VLQWAIEVVHNLQLTPPNADDYEALEALSNLIAPSADVRTRFFSSLPGCPDYTTIHRREAGKSATRLWRMLLSTPFVACLSRGAQRGRDHLPPA